MRLCKMNISGFKSFLDPTTLELPNNLIGVVGPNGCGKSNIIDAIIWVMGESSAKHLRGNALTDVIFNGSTSRGAVSQASVELFFDNSSGKLGGQYANYSTLSVKRQINRDSVSNYYLNGTRCRRRDIQEIFLGTGLGNRSYAIIKQGTISHLIDAKPDELRTFIEEAAGISKYRERRRETENRIKHTRENISRLKDIRDELGKQLNHLRRQARDAEKYKALKEEQRLLQAQLLAFNWQDLSTDLREQTTLVVTQENLVEAGAMELRRIEGDLEQYRGVQVSASMALDKIQADAYSAGSEISKIEQQIKHATEIMATIQQDIERVQHEISDAIQNLQQDQSQLETLMLSKNKLEPELQATRDQNDEAYQRLNKAEQVMQEWQIEWDSCNESLAECSRQQQAAGTRLEYLLQGLEEATQQRKTLEQELVDLDMDVQQVTIDRYMSMLQEMEEKQAKIVCESNEKKQSSLSLSDEIKDMYEQINEKSHEQQKLEGRLSSLEVLQKSSFGGEHEDTNNWLTSVGLADKPRLVQKIDVEPDWEYAVEIVLANDLSNIVVDNDEQYIMQLSTLNTGDLGICSMKKQDPAGQGTTGKSEFTRLSEKINTDTPLPWLLEGVYVADDLDAAKQIRMKLKYSESVITRDGLWLGRSWSRVCRGMDERKRTLSREKKINALRSECAITGQYLKALKAKIEQQRSSYEIMEQASNDLQSSIHEQHEEISECRAKLVAGRAQQEQIVTRVSKIKESLVTLEEQIKDDKFEVKQSEYNLKIATDKFDVSEQERQRLIELKKQYMESHDQSRRHWQDTHEESHGVALEFASINSKYTSLEQALQRNHAQLKALQERNKTLDNTLNDQEKLSQDYRASLELKLAEKLAIDKSLADARAELQGVNYSLKECEKLKNTQEQKIQKLRDSLEKCRLATQESQIRLQNVTEQLTATGHDPEATLSQLEKGFNIDDWKKRLERLSVKIENLGLINLAAIDEFSQLNERKTYLDSQHEDLIKALDMLESAVRKIDKETKSKFKDTFDRLNINLEKKFSQLFGGGHAYLELTSEDILQTGVTIMAMPPGKRNSTIHLLSGGEKALTAVALVFAIFALNPAPFCILDEVDAPLDDQNIGRFSAMVKEMSADIQCIFVTHNKITMEIAQQLLGVTMHEAGVSRLVSVDIEEIIAGAVAM